MSLVNRIIAASLLSLPLLAAQAEIYRCQGPDGVVEYSNTAPAAGAARQCRTVEIGPITTIPAPRPPTASGAAASSAAPAQGPRGGAVPEAGKAGQRPADFPRVDPGSQKARDEERRRILQDEQGREESRAGELRRELASEAPSRSPERLQRLRDDLARSEANLQAIRREIDGIRP